MTQAPAAPATPAGKLFERSVLVSYEAAAFSPSRDAAVELASASRKKKDIQTFMDPVKLRPLNAFKQEAFRACRQHGTKLSLLNAYVVDETLESAIWGKLSDVQKRWNEFCNNSLFQKYEDHIQAYAKANPAEALDILALAPSRTEITRSVRFDFAVIRLTSDQIKSPGLESSVRSLADQALDEIAAEVMSAKVSSSGQFTQATKGLMQRLRRKAQALAFLHPRLDELQAVLGRVVEQLPTTGIIRGADAVVVKATLLPLLDASAFKDHGFQAPMPAIAPSSKSLPILDAAEDAGDTGADVGQARVDDDAQADALPEHAGLLNAAAPAAAVQTDWSSF